MREILFDLLPDNGASVSFDAVQAALSEREGRDIGENELSAMIFALGAERKISWVPDEKRVGRASGSANTKRPWPISREQDLEPWFERYLWMSAHRFYAPPPRSLGLIVEITARTATFGGRWTRPDLSMACVARYRFQAVPQFDLFTFELKLADGCDARAVYEALSHSAAANFAYLGIYLPDDIALANRESIIEQAQRHGVGVISIREPRDVNSYAILVPSRRHSPSPAKIDGFIEDRFMSINKLALDRWVKP